MQFTLLPDQPRRACNVQHYGWTIQGIESDQAHRLKVSLVNAVKETSWKIQIM
jgi:hypothetical protein